MSNQKHVDFIYTDATVPMDKYFPLYLDDWQVHLDDLSELHRHPHFEVGICFKGYGLYMLDGKVHTYHEGDIVAVGPAVFHKAHTDNADNDLWSFLSFETSFFSDIKLNDEFKMVIPKYRNPYLHDTVYQIWDLTRHPHPDSRKMIKALMASLISQLEHEYNVEKNRHFGVQQKSESFDTRIISAIGFMTENIANASIEEAAEHCNMSVSYFREVFREQVGMAPKEYQTQLRLKKAVNLIRYTDYTMLDIALECGFNSVSSLNRQFMHHYKMTPYQMKKHQL